MPFSGVFSRDGNYFYTGGSVGTGFAGFTVAPATGVLTPLPGAVFNSGGSNPLGYATDAGGRLFSVNYASDQIRAFTTSGGVPTAVSGNPFSAGGLVQGVAGVVHAAGFYMVADRGGNKVGVYQIAGSGSATTMTNVAGSPFATGGTFTDALALAKDGQLLFAANGTSRNLTVFGVNSGSGALTALLVQPTNTLGNSGLITGLVFAPSASPDGDYDGDGKTDIDLYRPSTGTWYVKQSGANYTTALIQSFGVATDVPVAGDYDGDGKADFALYRPSNGTWYVLKSSTNFTTP